MIEPLNTFGWSQSWLFIAGFLLVVGVGLAIWLMRDGDDDTTKKANKALDRLEDKITYLQAENESLANYRRLWEAAAIELRAANAKIAKLEKVPKKVKK